MNLPDFLRARIEEDEEMARAYLRPWFAARVLAECRARRRIVDRVESNIGITVADDWVLNALAFAYDDHPDFQDVWRP